jgi:uncharacterized membrane protein
MGRPTDSGATDAGSTGDNDPDRRWLAAGSYLVMPASGVAVSPLVDATEYEQFHAVQSAFPGVGLAGLLPVSVFAANLPFFLFAVRLYFVAAVVVWVVAMLTAYNGIEFEFPVAGPLARDYLNG